jgi:hypothetical protein
MQTLLQFRAGLGIAAVLAAVFCQGAPAQDTPAKDAPPIREATGIPPRTAPTEYQAHAQAGLVTVAAEFTRHSVATLQATLSTEDYVVVEVGLFGPPETRVKLSHEDFSLRINGKRFPLHAQPYGLVLSSLKDPEWQPPVTEGSKSKTGISTDGGGQNGGEPPPTPPKMPFELVRVMQQRVQKAVLPEGDRLLPVAGLIFFEYRGKPTSIRSIDLTYDGPAGKAVLALRP